MKGTYLPYLQSKGGLQSNHHYDNLVIFDIFMLQTKEVMIYCFYTNLLHWFNVQCNFNVPIFP
jgi:hypothetical protein